MLRRVASVLPCLNSDQKKLVMVNVPEKKYPVNSKDYKLYEEVGEGVSATVYRALCVPLNEIVAIKVLDFERCNNDLDSAGNLFNAVGSLISPPPTNLSASSLLPSLHCILQQNELQREEIMKSIKYLQQISA